MCAQKAVSSFIFSQEHSNKKIKELPPKMTEVASSGSCLKIAISLSLLPLQWIPFLMFEILNSCRRNLVCAIIMPSIGKSLSWCALLPNFKKNQKRKLVSSQISLVQFPNFVDSFGVLQRHKSTIYCRSLVMSNCIDEVQ